MGKTTEPWKLLVPDIIARESSSASPGCLTCSSKFTTKFVPAHEIHVRVGLRRAYSTPESSKVHCFLVLGCIVAVMSRTQFYRYVVVVC